ncbi:hypothetical protein Syun_008799 [Stephania yunnanensis]|uniref:Non-specific lipid-transfer protein n=1 Tax=Stephania yunnanensis TaxID=152371 RepID=A0AAP0PQB5_9MAGN
MVQLMVEPSQAVNCVDVDKSLLPCLTFLTGQVPEPAGGCCDGVKALKGLVTTTADKRQACNCVKQAAAHYQNIKDDAVSSLAGKCGAPVSFPISKNIDCNSELKTASRGVLLNDVEITMLARHEQWMYLHGRVYKDATEKEKRFNVFKENVKYIEQFNKGGNHPYKLSVNEFADLTNEEFKATRNGYKGLCLEDKLARATASTFKYENVSAVPSTVDWRKKGVVTPVKDQGQCGMIKLIISFQSLQTFFV